jgi:hypothetical protein
VSGGYVNPWRGKCHACKGAGFFKTSPEKRADLRKKRADKKAASAELNFSDWADKNAALASYLLEVRSWNGFAASLTGSIRSYGDLTPNQATALNSLKFKHDAKQAQKAAADERREVLDLSKILELFDTARASGLKRLGLTVGKLRISVAPATGVNAGCLYVKDDGEYAGKITAESKFYGLRSARGNIEAELIELAKDPRGQAKLHGQETGKCSCCSRELTDPKSIELGIGPVCLENWGL